jgi:hypothetical protein
MPLLLLGCVVAARMPAPAALIPLAIGAVAVGCLLWQARSRRLEAGDALVDALIVERVKAPVFEALDQEMEVFSARLGQRDRAPRQLESSPDTEVPEPAALARGRRLL